MIGACKGTSLTGAQEQFSVKEDLINNGYSLFAEEVISRQIIKVTGVGTLTPVIN